VQAGVSGASDVELLVHLIDDLECGAVPLEELKTIFHGDERYWNVIRTIQKLEREAAAPPRPPRKKVVPAAPGARARIDSQKQRTDLLRRAREKGSR